MLPCMSVAPFAQVAFVLPLRQTFTYRIPEALLADVRPGAHVVAPFRGRPRRGFVVDLVADTALKRLESLDSVLEQGAISPHLLALSKWIADYYLAPLGEGLGAALPGGLEGFARSRDRRGAVEDNVVRMALPERVVLTAGHRPPSAALREPLETQCVAAAVLHC